MSEEVPLIDLKQCGLLVEEESVISDEAFEHAGKLIYSALSTSGFAYLSNHGIARSLIDDVNEVASNFFAQPDEEKKKLYQHEFDFGYDPIGASKADMSHVDAMEGFRISAKSWHDENTPWPNVPMFKDCCFNAADACKKLVFRILKALGVAMKLKDRGYFFKSHSLMNQKGNSSMIKMIKYPPLLSDEILPETKLRFGEHADWTTLIMLFQDSVGGLQIKSQSGKFMDVVPIPNTIVLSVGDTLQAWSAGRLKSTIHRVVPPSDPKKRKNVRRSIVYFAQANDDIRMEDLQYEDGVSEPQKPQENVMTVEQYMAKKFAMHFY